MAAPPDLGPSSPSPNLFQILRAIPVKETVVLLATVIVDLDSSINAQSLSSTLLRAMPLLDLSTELILLIAKNLKPRNISPLLRTNKQLSIILIPEIRKLACKEKYATVALFCAASHGNEEMIRFLLEKGDDVKVVKRIANVDEIVFTAPRECNDEIVQFVLEQGANLILEDRHDPKDANAKHKKWWQQATEWRTGRSVDSSESEPSDDELEEGLKTNPGDHPRRRIKVPKRHFTPLDPVNRTALHWALLHGHSTLIKTLPEKGANIESRGNGGRTAINEAAYQRNEAAVKLLLERGANVNTRDDVKRAPLHHAAYGGMDETVRLLIEYGADPTVKDRWEATAMELGEYGDLDCGLLWEKFNARTREKEAEFKVFYAAVASGDVVAARESLKRGCDVDKSYLEDRMPSTFKRAIVVAAKQGNEEMVEMLLDNGSRDFVDQAGRSARFIAADRNRFPRPYVAEPRTSVEHMYLDLFSDYEMSDVEAVYSDLSGLDSDEEGA